MAINWTALYDGSGPTLNRKEAQRLISIMCGTAKVHRDNDFKHRPGREPWDKVLKRKANNGNWIKIRVGDYGDSDENVVIIYHKLKHFLPAIRWSISVGIYPTIFDTQAPATIAKDVSAKLHDDTKAGVNNILGATAALVVYDHVYPRGATTNGIALDPIRQATPIGNLGLIAENLADVQTAWTIDRSIQLRPQKAAGGDIPGWARDAEGALPKDFYVIRTILTPK